MTEINPFDGLGITPPVADNTGRSELGQEDFMKLMIAQFRNQDPFEPMDNGDFLGQLAQFGTVSGIDELNSSFSGLQGSIQSEQALQAANLVGHSVLAETESGYLPEEGSLSGAVMLSSSASNVQIEITDAFGALVHRFEMGQQPAGTARFSWDGRDGAGDVMPSGQYRVNALVMYGSQAESAETLIEANIESITLGRGGEGLTLNLAGGEQLDLSRVRQII
ncbi:MAG: flagellar hook assembly protein FlgD [Woeseia sp.]|nr:flagellar hook assembly protein FlgD [Woeseia sp.]MBT8097926.1 flagellar hook assembly protein FlgD [Woeseia sp.]NNE60054.1 flagellar hook assembly protein FlgD [Woeseia sp.]NNL55523.1 flagellar hook assembly protein FlgD [Woeseia sp.]